MNHLEICPICEGRKLVVINGVMFKCDTCDGRGCVVVDDWDWRTVERDGGYHPEWV